MKKYLLIAVNVYHSMLMYRVNFLMWRLRNIVQLLGNYFLWIALLGNNAAVFGYTQSQLLTYFFGIYVVSAIVLETDTSTVGAHIVSGDLNNYLVKPVGYLQTIFSREVAGKFIDTCFSFIEITVLFFLLQPMLFFQTDGIIVGVFILSLLIAILLHFLFGLLLGFIGFWSNEIWAPRFLFSIIISFFAGAYFPLDIVPEQFSWIFSYLPFAYMLYFPVKLYLGQLSGPEMIHGIAIGLFWLSILTVFVNVLWRKGLQIYGAYGR